MKDTDVESRDLGLDMYDLGQTDYAHQASDSPKGKQECLQSERIELQIHVQGIYEALPRKARVQNVRQKAEKPKRV